MGSQPADSAQPFSGRALTLHDYDHSKQYRELLFHHLEMQLSGSVALIIGHSLRDQHILQLVQTAVDLQKSSGAPGRIHLLLRDVDDERATIWHKRGIYRVHRTDLNEFVHRLTNALTPAEDIHSAVSLSTLDLPRRLRSCTINVRETTDLPNAQRLFYGGAASYEDVRSNLTFERDQERELQNPDRLATIITGVAGTGKTTLARRLMVEYASNTDLLCYEHRSEFSLDDRVWLDYEQRLRAADRRAILLIDNATLFQRQVNTLVGGLPPESHLHVLLTAETSGWKIRQKHPRFFSAAKPMRLSTLSRNELRELLDRVLHSEALRLLVDAGFLRARPT